MYIAISSIIAAIPFLVLPTMSPGLVFLSVALAAFAGIILMKFISPRLRNKIAKEPFPQIPLMKSTGRPVSGFTPEQERRLLKFGFHSLIQRQLTEIERRLDFQNPKPIQFSSWNDFQEDVKKQYIDDHRTYEIIEKIAKVLDEWNKAVNRADLLRVQPNSGTIHLCIQGFRTYHDKLKEHDLLI